MATSSTPSPSRKGSKLVGLIFFALVLDLLAFTIPLPLFPRIIEWYTLREAAGSQTDTLLSRTLRGLTAFRALVAPGTLAPSQHEHMKKWDVVLLGGLLGSIFSFCQFLVSPWIGTLSDRYGRRPILLLSMLGNILAAAIWVSSTSFASFLVARLVGGLSEGNVQLSIAILTDITSPATRPRSLALVGLAFSLAFTFGPSLGAYFASRPLLPALSLAGRELNIYAAPAVLATVLLLVETAVLYQFLPETKTWRGTVDEMEGEKEKEEEEKKQKKVATIEGTPEQREKALSDLRGIHRTFLLLFSGVEFTLTFLTYDLFGASNAQNGRLLGFIGILSSLLQGGYTRRASARPLVLAYRGILSTALGLLLLSLLPFFPSADLLYAGAACLAFTSASVVTGLQGGTSLLLAEKGVESQRRGEVLGKFRSSGQLGRALGPLVACSTYWVLGPFPCYALSGTALAFVALEMRALVVQERTGKLAPLDIPASKKVD